MRAQAHAARPPTPSLADRYQVGLWPVVGVVALFLLWLITAANRLAELLVASE